MAALFTIDTGVVQNSNLPLDVKAVLRSLVDTLNAAVDVSASEADLAKLAAITATAAEVNYLDITALGTGAASKAVVLDASGDYTFPAAATIVMPSGGDMTFASGSTLDVAGTFEIANVAVTASAAELNYLDIAALGTGAASKAVVLDASGDYTFPATATITMPSGGTMAFASGSTLYSRGLQSKAQAAPAAKTVTAGITAAELVAGIITTTGATGPSLHQLPTGTEIDAAFPGIATGDSFDFHIINTGTGASDDATITVNTDVTIVGNPTAGALTDATILSGSATFRARRSNANTYVVYRIA